MLSAPAAGMLYSVISYFTCTTVTISPNCDIGLRVRGTNCACTDGVHDENRGQHRVRINI